MKRADAKPYDIWATSAEDNATTFSGTSIGNELSYRYSYTVFSVILLELYSADQVLIHFVSPRDDTHVQQHSAHSKQGSMGDAFLI